MEPQTAERKKKPERPIYTIPAHRQRVNSLLENCIGKEEKYAIPTVRRRTVSCDFISDDDDDDDDDDDVDLKCNEENMQYSMKVSINRERNSDAERVVTFKERDILSGMCAQSESERLHVHVDQRGQRKTECSVNVMQNSAILSDLDIYQMTRSLIFKEKYLSQESGTASSTSSPIRVYPMSPDAATFESKESPVCHQTKKSPTSNQTETARDTRKVVLKSDDRKEDVNQAEKVVANKETLENRQTRQNNEGMFGRLQKSLSINRDDIAEMLKSIRLSNDNTCEMKSNQTGVKEKVELQIRAIDENENIDHGAAKIYKEERPFVERSFEKSNSVDLSIDSHENVSEEKPFVRKLYNRSNSVDLSIDSRDNVSEVKPFVRKLYNRSNSVDLRIDSSAKVSEEKTFVRNAYNRSNSVDLRIDSSAKVSEEKPFVRNAYNRSNSVDLSIDSSAKVSEEKPFVRNAYNRSNSVDLSIDSSAKVSEEKSFVRKLYKRSNSVDLSEGGDLNSDSQFYGSKQEHCSSFLKQELTSEDIRKNLLPDLSRMSNVHADWKRKRNFSQDSGIGTDTHVTFDDMGIHKLSIESDVPVSGKQRHLSRESALSLRSVNSVDEDMESLDFHEENHTEMVKDSYDELLFPKRFIEAKRPKKGLRTKLSKKNIEFRRLLSKAAKGSNLMEIEIVQLFKHIMVKIWKTSSYFQLAKICALIIKKEHRIKENVQTSLFTKIIFQCCEDLIYDFPSLEEQQHNHWKDFTSFLYTLYVETKDRIIKFPLLILQVLGVKE